MSITSRVREADALFRDVYGKMCEQWEALAALEKQHNKVGMDGRYSAEGKASMLKEISGRIQAARDELQRLSDSAKSGLQAIREKAEAETPARFSVAKSVKAGNMDSAFMQLLSSDVLTVQELDEIGNSGKYSDSPIMLRLIGQAMSKKLDETEAAVFAPIGEVGLRERERRDAEQRAHARLRHDSEQFQTVVNPVSAVFDRMKIAIESSTRTDEVSKGCAENLYPGIFAECQTAAEEIDFPHD